MTGRRLAAFALAGMLVVTACGDDDTPADSSTTTTTTTTAGATAPAMSPAEIVFDAQTSDGTTIVVASVTLPAAGFVVVHGNADGGPGPVVGHSDLLDAGTWTDVVITLDTPLQETDLLFPMAHIDVDADGVYDFSPPDETTDAPAMTAEGDVAVTGAEVTVTAAIPEASGIVFDAQTSDGTTIVITSVSLPQPGFIAVHANADGAPGPIVGHSDLLDAGTWTDVVVTLDTPLQETDLLFPMVHLDVDDDGAYDFTPPYDTTDTPGLTADGGVAVTGAEVTVGAAEIDIEGFDFGDPITVPVGSEVLVHNNDGVTHTWTSADGSFDSGSIAGGGDFTFTFDEPGEYDFFCSIHPSMTGTIVVTG